MNNSENKKKISSEIFFSCLILGVLLFCVKFLIPASDNHSDKALEEGLSYLSSLESRDAAQINSIIMAANSNESSKEDIIIIYPDDNDISSEHYTDDDNESEPENPYEQSNSGTEAETESVPEQSEETSSQNEEFISLFKDQIESGNIISLTEEERASYKNRLVGCAIIGDSMAQAAIEYGFLDSSHVFYRRGFAIGQLTEAIEEAAAMLPTTVIFFTGLNDTDYYPDIADYQKAYFEKLELAQSLMPQAKIYVCSMLPPSNALGAVRPDLARAPYYTQALKDMCMDSGFGYIDTTWMVNQSLYMADGIHFISSFYDIWIQYITLSAGL